MVFDPPIPPPKPFNLNKAIKGRFYYLNEEVESMVNESLSAPLESQGHLLDFYQDIRSNPTNRENH